MEENFLFRSSLKRVKEVINLNRVFNYLGDDVYDETLSEIILPEFSRNTVTEKLLVSREKVSHYEIRFKRVFVAQVFPTRCKNTYLQNLDRIRRIITSSFYRISSQVPRFIRR